MEYSFHTILGTTFLFGEHDFSRLVINRAVYYDKWPITDPISKIFRYGLS